MVFRPPTTIKRADCIEFVALHAYVSVLSLRQGFYRSAVKYGMTE